MGMVIKEPHMFNWEINASSPTTKSVFDISKMLRKSIQERHRFLMVFNFMGFRTKGQIIELN